jgi:uncharacterized membrane protein
MSAQKVDTRTMYAVSAAIVLTMFAVSAWAWGQLPAGSQIPVHWNAAGEVDGYGSKFTGLLLMPLMGAGIVGLFALIPRIEPRAANLAQSGGAFRALWLVLLLYFLLLHGALVLNILGYGVEIARVIPVLMGVLFLVIGYAIRDIRSNFLMGIRTPWTLSSELSWRKTHRMGGALFMLIGVAMLGALFLPATWWVWLMLAGIGLLLPIIMVYSWYVWKHDPDRLSG